MDFMRKKVLNNINDIQLDFQKTKEALKVDIHDIKCKVDHHEEAKEVVHDEIDQEEIVIIEQPKPILKPNRGRRLKSAVNQVKISNKFPSKTPKA